MRTIVVCEWKDYWINFNAWNSLYGLRISLRACLSQRCFRKQRLLNLFKLVFISPRLGLPKNQSIQIPNNSGIQNKRSLLIIIISIIFQLLKSLSTYPNPLTGWNGIKSFICIIPLYPYKNTKRYYYLNFIDEQTGSEHEEA